jgi:NADH:ubiquinone oxidoreductase subunit 3 (subunit A)
MAIDSENLIVISFIALALALALGMLIVLIVFLIKMIGKANIQKQVQETSLDQKTIPKKVATAGKHLNRFYQITIYFIVFSILIVFLILATFTFEINIQFADIWPFLFLVVILIIYSLSLIDRAKGHSKRTAQRDMREL